MTNSFELTKFNKGKNRWDEFIEHSKNGTIFHEMNFLEYHGDRFNTEYYGIYDENKLLAVIAGVRKEESGKLIFESHPGATFGGPVFKKDITYETSVQIFDTIIDYFKESEIDLMKFRIVPSHLCNYESEELDFFVLHKGGRMLPPALTTFCKISESIKTMDDILYSISSRARRAYRKAIKSDLEIKWDDNNFKEFHEILRENLVERYNTTPTHSLEELLLLKEKYNHRIFLSSAYLDDEMITGTVIFILNDISAHTFYFATRQEAYSYNGLNYVIPFSLLQLSQKFNIRNVNLGISSGKLGQNPNWGLFKFKESFQNRNVMRKTYEIDLI